LEEMTLHYPHHLDPVFANTSSDSPHMHDRYPVATDYYS
jgi:hypothetical protein